MRECAHRVDREYYRFVIDGGREFRNNRDQKQTNPQLRFRGNGNGNGQGVYWEVVSSGVGWVSRPVPMIRIPLRLSP